MKDLNQGLFDFIAGSPTCFHAVHSAAKTLDQAGFSHLSEGSAWKLEAGKGYYVTRNQSSLIAFRMPETLRSFMIAAAHTDSPCFRLKDNATVQAEGYSKLDANKYGGMIFSTWLDRPLSVAGRVMLSTDQGVEARLVNLEQDLLVIPSLAIHMDRTTNEGKKLTAQTELMPLLGKGNVDILELVAKELGVDRKQILAQDLFVYNREAGTKLGPDGELILCPRLDDLQCVYGLLEGFLAAAPSGSVPVFCAFDNEEVGSETKQGAASSLLSDTLRRIALALGLGEEGYLRLLAQSFLVSADNAHAVHPNHPEYADMTNTPRMNGGVVIKFNANQRYTTDGVSCALFTAVCREAKAPVQVYANRSDLPGGSTLGSIATTKVSVPSVDIGLAQLAMHSCVETAGAEDLDALVRAMTVYYGKTLRRAGETLTF